MNARRLSKLLRSRPFKPAETILRYVDFVAENGPLTQLHSLSGQLNFFQYYCLDLLLTAVVLLILAVTIGLWAIRQVINQIRNLVAGVRKEKCA